MRMFRYVAMDNHGKELRGQVEAEDSRTATQQLRDQGLFIVEMDDGAAPIKRNANEVVALMQSVKPITAMQKVFFFRQMTLMLRSGLSLTDSLGIMQELMSGKFSSRCAEMATFVRGGDSFSNAINGQGRFFPSMVTHMVASAEATGELDIVMDRIGGFMERKADLRRQMMTAMMYPLITMLMTAGLFYFLVTGVVPKFAKFFEDSGKTLPAQTQSLLDLSKFLDTWGLLITILIVLAVAVVGFIYSTSKGRLKIDSLLLSIPIIGSVISYGAMSQLGWSISMLLRSGLTLVEALEVTRDLTSNRAISNATGDALAGVLRGQDLSSSLNSKVISPLIQQMAAIGERSGTLDTVMHEAGIFYEESLKAKNKVLANMLEPVSIVIIGGMVAYVYIAFFKAIFAVSGG